MRRFVSTTAFGLGGLAMMAACGGGADNAPDTQTSTTAAAEKVTGGERSDACPLAIEGTTQSIEDTVDGVVVLFATPNKADLTELRRRVDALAEVHQSSESSAAQDSAAAPPQGPGTTANQVGAEDKGKLEAVASVEMAEGDKGVRLVLRPRDPAQLDSVRAPLRKQADDLVQGVCDEAGRKNLH
ncbi:MAG TPA: hypothetical protein VK698_37710 [Kofleriaceae bacterium]|nr:hypothetical protein [Kofleriaceae bacterium]